MSNKTTPSGRALEYFIKMCDSMALDPNAACNPEIKTIRTALLRSHAIESGELVRQLSDDGFNMQRIIWNDLLERLKGIGHEIPVQE